jgi:hypothetical protein
MLEYLVFVAAFASLLAAAAYIRSMFKGNTLPNRVTWIMWSLHTHATPLQFPTALKGSTYRVYGWFCPLLIFISSFFTRKAYWALSKLDYLCGVLSGFALVFWYITQEPNLAIALAITSDAFAAFPTLIKTWRNPQTESVWPYLIGIFSPLTSFAAASAWNFSELAFSVYLTIMNCLLVTSVYHKKLFAH